MQASDAVRDARNNAIETTIGTSPVMQIRTGAAPANCAAANTGTILATLTLPANFFNASSAGVMTFLGTWQDLIADNPGAFGHYRVFDSTVTTCHMQGPCGVGQELSTSSASIAAGESFTVTGFTITDGNALTITRT